MQVRSNVLQHVSPELKSLYYSLEIEFDPLNLSSKLAPCLDFVGQREDLAKYVEGLQEMTVIRLIKQVCLSLCFLFPSLTAIGFRMLRCYTHCAS